MHLVNGCPPYILYKGKNILDQWMPCRNPLDSGWMERANFLHWLKKLFLPAMQHLTSTPGVVLFVDGHHSHLSMELAKEKGVHLVCFPPRLTHSTATGRECVPSYKLMWVPLSTSRHTTCVRRGSRPNHGTEIS